MGDWIALPGIVVLLVLGGGWIAVAGSDTATPSVEGPIPFEVLDLDGSGGVSEQEFDEVRGRRAKAREQAGLPPVRGGRSFGSIDGDHDGVITPAELQTARESAGAGLRRSSEKRGGRGLGGRRGSPPSFSDFDLNGDGAVTEAEFTEARNARLVKRAGEGRKLRGLPYAPTFSQLDADEDGSLTPEEFEAAVRSHQQSRERGGPAGADP
jgi:Ca2+-binding EF-hand superfamily protein